MNLGNSIAARDSTEQRGVPRHLMRCMRCCSLCTLGGTGTTPTISFRCQVMLKSVSIFLILACRKSMKICHILSVHGHACIPKTGQACQNNAVQSCFLSVDPENQDSVAGQPIHQSCPMGPEKRVNLRHGQLFEQYK